MPRNSGTPDRARSVMAGVRGADAWARRDTPDTPPLPTPYSMVAFRSQLH